MAQIDPYTIFNRLSTGGLLTMPLKKPYWGAYFVCLQINSASIGC